MVAAPLYYQREPLSLSIVREKKLRMKSFLQEELQRARFARLATQEPPALLEEIYQLCEQKQGRIALAMLFDVLDRWLSAGDFARVELAMREVVLTRVADSVVLGFLTISRPAKGSLEERGRYLERARAHLLTTMDEARVSRLLQGVA